MSATFVQAEIAQDELVQESISDTVGMEFQPMQKTAISL